MPSCCSIVVCDTVAQIISIFKSYHKWLLHQRLWPPLRWLIARVTHLINTPYQHTLSTHTTDSPSQTTFPNHPLNPLSQSIYAQEKCRLTPCYCVTGLSSVKRKHLHHQQQPHHHHPPLRISQRGHKTCSQT